MKNILLVEDNEDTADAVKLILKNAGFKTHVVTHGNECHDFIDVMDFDLILLDLMPPELYGYDIYESLRKKTDSKVAFHSAVSISPAIVNLFKKVGISDHIEKPYNKTDLLLKIQNIIRGL